MKTCRSRQAAAWAVGGWVGVCVGGGVLIIQIFSVSTRPLFISSSEIIFTGSCHSTSSLTPVLLLQA